MKFIALNQVNRSLVFRAVKHKYVSYLQTPFEVKEKVDQQFFLKKPRRFAKVGVGQAVADIIANVITPEERDVDDKLRNYLSTIPIKSRSENNLTTEEIDKIVTSYTYLSEFLDDVRAGATLLGGLVSPRVGKNIEAHVLDGGEYPVKGERRGYYILSDGQEVKGRRKATKLQKELDEVNRI